MKNDIVLMNHQEMLTKIAEFPGPSVMKLIKKQAIFFLHSKEYAQFRGHQCWLDW